MKRYNLFLLVLLFVAGCDDEMKSDGNIENIFNIDPTELVESYPHMDFIDCGEQTAVTGDGETLVFPEEYNLKKLNAELAHSAELRESTGMSFLVGCEDARAFMPLYEDYLRKTREMMPEEPRYTETVFEEEEAYLAETPKVSGIWMGQKVVKPGVVWLSSLGCTGFVISRWNILTAAHCIPKELSGTLDKINIVTKTSSGVLPPQTYHAMFYRYPDYSGTGNSSNDIGAILVFDQDWTYAANESHRFRIWDGGHCTQGTDLHIYGWGRSGMTISNSGEDLREGKGGDRIHITECHPSYFYARARDARICPGDSGGPAIYEEGNIDFVFGIASYVWHLSTDGYCTEYNRRMYWQRIGDGYKMKWLTENVAGLQGEVCKRIYSDSNPKGYYYRCW